MTKKFSKNSLLKLYDNDLYWNLDGYNPEYSSYCGAISFDKLIKITGITERKIINDLKKFVNNGGRIEINFKNIYGLILSLYFEDNDKRNICLENIPIEFYHKINKIIEIDQSNLAYTMIKCKRATEVYKQFSDDEKLKLELELYS